MQVAQLVMVIMCNAAQMALVSSCQGWTWHLPRKSFMVILRSLWYPPQPPIDWSGRRGCRQLWSSRTHCQQPAETTTGTELCTGLLPKAHLLWQAYSGRAYSRLKFAVLYMDASIVYSSYQCSGRQNTIHNDSCR